MTAKPKAIELAEAICDYSRYGYESELDAKVRRMESHSKAASLLRSQHALIGELVEALDELLIAYCAVGGNSKDGVATDAAAALAKAEAQQ